MYFPDWAGNLNAVNRTTGALLWSRSIASYTGVAGDYSRATPAIAGDKLIFGDQAGKIQGPARLMAVDKATGNLLWVTVADSHPFSIITQSAIVKGNDVYVGIASIAQCVAAAGSNPAAVQACLPGDNFFDAVMALDLKTGAIK